MKGFVLKGKGGVADRAIITHVKGKPLALWREAVKSKVLEVKGAGRIQGPVLTTLCYHLPSPKSRPKVLNTLKQRWEWEHPWRKPDLEKLTRAVMDALKGVLLVDDAQVVKRTEEKIFSDEPGVEIIVQAMYAVGEK